MTVISIHLANTIDGEYDVRLALPKPLHCDPPTGSLVHSYHSSGIVQVVGFTSDPDEFEVDIEWSEWAGSDPMDPSDIVGLFPVVASADDNMATLTLPVLSVSVDGRQVER